MTGREGKKAVVLTFKSRWCFFSLSIFDVFCVVSFDFGFRVFFFALDVRLVCVVVQTAFRFNQNAKALFSKRNSYRIRCVVCLCQPGISIYLSSIYVLDANDCLTPYIFVSCMNLLYVTVPTTVVHTLLSISFSVCFFFSLSCCSLLSSLRAAIFFALSIWILSIKTCICLMMKWQLNVSRVDSVRCRCQL